MARIWNRLRLGSGKLAERRRLLAGTLVSANIDELGIGDTDVTFEQEKEAVAYG